MSSKTENQTSLTESPLHPEDIEDQRAELFHEIAEQFAAELRGGRCPSISEYANRYPPFAADILRLLPTILALENAKASNISNESGGATLAGETPQVLGDFLVVGEIGRGAMGVVYKAYDRILERTVALKVLPRDSLSQEIVDRFEQESKLTARLHHSSIVPVFACGEQSGFRFYAMQLIEGKGLDSAILNGESLGNLSEHARWVASVGKQTADALNYAHEKGVLHRDIKPANLLLDADGRIWITDFGLSCIASDNNESTGTSGTERFMAPERLTGGGDFRSDVYSLGATLHELLKITPKTATSNCFGISVRDLKCIIAKAMAHRAEDRYQSAAALSDDLGRFLRSMPVTARCASRLDYTAKWIGRNKTISVSVLVIMIATLTVASVSFVSYRQIDSHNKLTQAKNVQLIRSIFTIDALLSISLPTHPVSLNEGAEQREILPAEIPRLRSKVFPDFHDIETTIARDPNLMAEAIRARCRVGKILLDQGKFDEAMRAFQYALILTDRLPACERLDTYWLDPELHRIRIMLLFAKVHQGKRDFEQAYELRNQSLERLKLLSTELDPESISYLTAETHFLIAQASRLAFATFSQAERIEFRRHIRCALDHIHIALHHSPTRKKYLVLEESCLQELHTLGSVRDGLASPLGSFYPGALSGVN